MGISMKTAVLGYGVVGVGVHEMLYGAAGLEPGPVLVRPGKERESFMRSSLDEILSDASVGAVVEVMGGVEPAFSYVSAALEAGKHVVSSNKALVAAKGPELARLAAEKGVAFLFSAACGGAIPFLHNLSLAVQSDRVESLGGLLNGTTNFILDAMQSSGADYADALREAQALGYAERDPSADVSGLDTLRKIMLGCAVAWGLLPDSGCDREGIESIRGSDVRAFRERGLVCRLEGFAAPAPDGGLSAWVQPVLLPESAIEAAVKRNFNLARYHGKNAGDIVMIGQGAGRWPTASAVLRDLGDILSGRRVMLPSDTRRVRAENDRVEKRFWLRLPRECAGAFSWAESEAEGELLRGVTEPMPVSRMHREAAALRGRGVQMFFAAMEERI